MVSYIRQCVESAELDPTIPAVLLQATPGRPRWLLNAYIAMNWVVQDTGDKPNKTISFDIFLPNGKRLSNYRCLLDSIKRIVFAVRHGPLMRVESGAVQAQIASNLFVLSRWMIANSIFRFSDLTASDIAEYSELAKFGINELLNAEGVLVRYLDQLCEKSGFDSNDTLEVRKDKASRMVPHYTGSNQRQLRIRRSEIFENAGLMGIGFNSSIKTILDDFEVACGFYTPPSRHNSVIRADEDEAIPVTEEHLRRLLMSFEYLFEYRNYLEEGLSRAPFGSDSARKIAQRYGRSVGRTASIPVKQAVTLIERSARWVLDYGPEIIDFKNSIDSLPIEATARRRSVENAFLEKKWHAEGPSSPFPIQAGMWKREYYKTGSIQLNAISLRAGMTLRLSLNYLLTACAVVIAAFSARRASEIIGLKAGCVERDSAGQPWLKTFIHKTINSDTVIPVPEIVASAVQVLEKISEQARLANKTDYLFQFNLPGSQGCVGVNSDGFPIFRFGEYLAKFGFFVDVPPLEDGSRWTFLPHQFRRFFAIIYVWFYDISDWGALSFHLRHFNPDQTRRYCMDKDMGHMIAVADREKTAKVLANVAFGRSKVGGEFGSRMKAIARRLHENTVQRVHVVSERKMNQRIMRALDRKGVELKPLLWGYCAYSTKTLHESKCSPASAHLPAVERATLSTCMTCSHSMRSEQFLPYLQTSLTFHSNVASSQTAPKIMREASRVLCEELSIYIDSVT